MKKRSFPLLAIASTLAFAVNAASAQKISDDVVRIGILTDMQGAYSDTAGKGSVIAAQMAIDDFGGTVFGKKIVLVSADHQHKADVGSTTARQWFDEGKVDAIFDVNNTAVHIAVARLATEKNRIVINTAAASSAITGEYCSPVVGHWPHDTYAFTKSLAKAVVQGGGKKWYVLAVDYTFGAALEKDITETLKGLGGSVVGSIKHPLNAPDFSSFLLSAQASKADVIALANVGTDTINAIKTARDFKIPDKQKVLATILFITDIHALGLETAQGMYATTAFYWDRNAETREWSKRFFSKHKKMPTSIQASAYSATAHYLKAIKASGTDDTASVMAMMKKTPVNDFFAKNGVLREDGRMVHDMYLVQVKTPNESKYPWDYYKVVATIPGEEAFRPMAEGNCAFVKNK